MKETIILSNLNEKELLKTKSLNNLVSFNTRIFNSNQLANEVLLRNGVVINGELIDSFKQECITFNLIKENDYFKNNNFNDSKNIVRQLNLARELCKGNEEEKLEEVLSSGEFIKKNTSLLKLYKSYKAYLKTNNLYDSIDVINYVINNNYSINSDFKSFKEENLYPLEKELLKVVSKENNQSTSLFDYVSDGKKPLKDITYDNSYGAINEIEHILGYIAKENIKYDDCLIVINDPSYFNHLINYSKVYKIPMTFTNGYPISSSNAAVIFNLLIKWDKGYNGLLPLLDLIEAKEFDVLKFFNNISSIELSPIQKDNILKQVGSLRLSTNKEINDQVIANYKSSNVDEFVFETINNIASELSKGYSYLIKTYTRIREGNNLDIIAIKTITETIDEFLTNIPNSTLADVSDVVMSKKILKQTTKPGSIAVCELNDALAISRNHTFITGLSARVFPGSPRENHLLLDSDLGLFGLENDEIPTSDKLINDKKELLFNVIDFANSLNSKIHLSYSGYSLVDIKEDNPSSMIFEIFKRERGETSSLKELNKVIGNQHTYFDESISINKDIGKKYLQGFEIASSDLKEDEYKDYKLNYKISPSAAEVFFECPRKFYLAKILRLKEPEKDDSFTLFIGGSVGTLVHECMEDYGNNPSWSEEEFKENAILKFDNFIKQRRTVHSENLNKDKQEYLDMALVGYRNDPHNKVYGSELELGPIEHYTGLVFGGRTDRIEQLENGNYIIVDYKTNRDLKHVDEDIDSCFQAVLYSWLLSTQLNVTVERGEYRYLRVPGTYVVTYNNRMKEQLDKKIEEFKNALDKGEFEPTPEDKKCRYCPYADICTKDNLEMEVDE